MIHAIRNGLAGDGVEPRPRAAADAPGVGANGFGDALSAALAPAPRASSSTGTIAARTTHDDPDGGNARGASRREATQTPRDDASGDEATGADAIARTRSAAALARARANARAGGRPAPSVADAKPLPSPPVASTKRSAPADAHASAPSERSRAPGEVGTEPTARPARIDAAAVAEAADPAGGERVEARGSAAGRSATDHGDTPAADTSPPAPPGMLATTPDVSAGRAAVASPGTPEVTRDLDPRAQAATAEPPASGPSQRPAGPPLATSPGSPAGPDAAAPSSAAAPGMPAPSARAPFETSLASARAEAGSADARIDLPAAGNTRSGAVRVDAPGVPQGPASSLPAGFDPAIGPGPSGPASAPAQGAARTGDDGDRATSPDGLVALAGLAASAAATAPTGAADAARAAPAMPQRFEVHTPVSDPAFPEAFADGIATLVMQGLDAAEIVVTPREMGPVRIELSLNGEAASIAFSATLPDTRAAIEQSLPTLRTMLAEHGIALADASVGPDTGTRERGESSDRRSAPATGGGGAERGGGGSDTPVPRPSRIRVGLLDLYA